MCGRSAIMAFRGGGGGGGEGGGGCWMDRFRGGVGFGRGPLIPVSPVTSRLWLRRYSNGYNISPDINICDGLAVLAMAWRIPVAGSRRSLGDRDSDSASCRAICRLRGWCRCDSDWGWSRLRMIWSHYWVAGSDCVHTACQIRGVVGGALSRSNRSRPRNEFCLGNVFGRGVSCVVGSSLRISGGCGIRGGC